MNPLFQSQIYFRSTISILTTAVLIHHTITRSFFVFDYMSAFNLKKTISNEKWIQNLRWEGWKNGPYSTFIHETIYFWGRKTNGFNTEREWRHPKDRKKSDEVKNRIVEGGWFAVGLTLFGRYSCDSFLRAIVDPPRLPFKSDKWVFLHQFLSLFQKCLAVTVWSRRKLTFFFAGALI